MGLIRARDEYPTRADGVQAFNEGRSAALRGLPPRAPYDMDGTWRGQCLAATWRRGWRTGMGIQAALHGADPVE